MGFSVDSFDPRQPRIVTPGGVPEVYTFKEGSTQTYVAGMPVKLSSGVVVVATDSTTGFLGIVQEDASGVASTAAHVQVVQPSRDRVLALVTSGGTDALASTLTVGEAYDFYMDSSVGLFYVDAADSSGGTLIFVQPVYDVNGDSTYWGIFELLAGQAGGLDTDAA